VAVDREPIRVITISREYGAGGSELAQRLAQRLRCASADVEATRAVLLEAVPTPPLIVIGHGANCLFHDRPDVLRVRVTAPHPVRVKGVAARTGQPPHEAATDVRHRDADRRHYLERYYRKAANDPCLYDLQINSASIPLEAAVRMVVTLARSGTAPA
jgi:cytidylate kinase